MSKKRRRIPVQQPQIVPVAPLKSRRRLLLSVVAVTVAAILATTFLFATSPRTKPNAASIKPARKSSLPAFGDLVLMSEEELAKQDVALLNLRSAEGLPGSEKLDVFMTLRELDGWANRVRVETDRNFHQFVKKPAEFQNSEAYFRMLLLVTVLQQDYGVHYNTAQMKDIDFTKSEDLFIHGMIGSKNGGTCVSMPALYTAVARRLGYPVFLVNAKEHVFCRWDGRGERVNIEGTNQGMNSFEDKHYMSWPHPISQDEVDRGIYLKSLSMPESLSLFLAARGHCQEDNDDRPNASVSYSLAVKHSPINPNYRIFLRRLVKPKTIEDFPEVIAEQQALHKRIIDPFSNSAQTPFGPTPEQYGLEPLVNIQPTPFTTFSTGVPEK